MFWPEGWNLHKTLSTTMVNTYPNFKGKPVIVPEKPISKKEIFNWYQNFGSPRLLVILQIYTFPVQKLTACCPFFLYAILCWETDLGALVNTCEIRCHPFQVSDVLEYCFSAYKLCKHYCLFDRGWILLYFLSILHQRYCRRNS